MTQEASMLELAERCEKATGPDRELDRLIELEIAPENSERIDIPLLEYTASLDAAMTLVGDNLLVALSDIAADGLTGCCICSDTSANPPTNHWGVPTESGPREQRLARALCAAALRASNTNKEQEQ